MIDDENAHDQDSELDYDFEAQQKKLKKLMATIRSLKKMVTQLNQEKEILNSDNKELRF